MLRIISRNLNKVHCKRHFSDILKEKKNEKGDNKSQKLIYGISVTSAFLITHGVFHLRRRNENKKTDSLVDTISFQDFLNKYLLEGKVSSIIYQVPFSIADVYLEEKLQNSKLSQKDQFKTNLMLKFTNKKQEVIARPPDIRVKFEEDSKSFKEIIKEVNENMKQTNESLNKEVKFSINEFPSRGEFFISILTSAAIAICVISM